MVTNNDDLAQAYRAAVVRRSELEPAEWCRENVRLYRSTDAQNFRPEYTPWWADVMLAVRSNHNREVCFTGPVGCGKSTFLEAITCNIQDQDPGPMLITGQTDDDIRDWAETGLWPTLKACAPLANKLAGAKHRKMELLLPRAPIHLTGANMSGLQSKSERWCMGDEAWMWKPGMITEMRKRLHRRWNGRVLLMGQAGFLEEGEEGDIIGDDFTLAHDQGALHEWTFCCPQCKAEQPYLMEQLQFPSDGTVAERAEQVVYECRDCKAAWPDTVATHRQLNETSRWAPVRGPKLPGHTSFHLNALALWRAPWSDLVAEYLNATHALRQGQTLPMQQFTQKQLALPWAEALSLDAGELDYVKPPAVGERLDGEVVRCMTVDVQRDHYWVLVRAWCGGGDSVGLYYARVNTEETLRTLQGTFGVEDRRVLVDSGFDSGRVYDVCARFGWVAIKGDQAKSYRHAARSARSGQGKSTVRLFSPVRQVLAPCGARVPLVHLATDPIKDILARLRTPEGTVRWSVAEDVGRDYLAQIDSERKEEFLNPKDNQPTTRWVRKKRHNHAWDTEVYQVGAALMFRVFGD